MNDDSVVIAQSQTEQTGVSSSDRVYMRNKLAPAVTESKQASGRRRVIDGIARIDRDGVGEACRRTEELHAKAGERAGLRESGDKKDACENCFHGLPRAARKYRATEMRNPGQNQIRILSYVVAKT